jgi:hypothetical protein
MRRSNLAALLPAVLLAGCGNPGGFRHTASITVTRPGAFVELPLPVSVYARSVQPGLRDLRVVDSSGGRVSFALLNPRVAEAQQVEQAREVTLYPLPPRPARGQVWRSPVEVTVEGDRIKVARAEASGPDPAAGGPGGWLVDLGEPTADAPYPDRIRLQWSGAAEFTAGFTLETSDDLSDWREAPGGQLMALSSPSGLLAQPFVRLPPHGGRFVRLAWLDQPAPVITGATALVARTERIALDPPETLVLPPMPARPADSTGALEFDLGGELPVLEVGPRFQAGNLVVPARLDGRSRPEDPWHELGSAVFYRLDRGAAGSAISPPLLVGAAARYLRLVPDRRAAALDPRNTVLEVKAQLATLVFAMQGSGPFRLEVGSSTAEPGALPAATLVPGLEAERARFGRASLGEWTEVAAVARAADRDRQVAAVKPWLLWGVLIAGIAGLGLMVWRLAKQR